MAARAASGQIPAPTHPTRSTPVTTRPARLFAAALLALAPLPLAAQSGTSTLSAGQQLARGIYDERAFDRLPILADALQDAGCEDEQVLAHSRGPGPHARGCWVVDLVIGKA